MLKSEKKKKKKREEVYYLWTTPLDLFILCLQHKYFILFAGRLNFCMFQARKRKKEVFCQDE